MNEKFSFFQSVKKIFIGSSLERLILICFTPILTRVYSPEDFALFAIFSSFVAVFASIRCLNYQVLIVTKDDNEIQEIINDTFKISFLLFFIYLIFSFFLKYLNYELFKKIESYSFLICVTIFISNISAIFHHIFIRYEEYRNLNLIRIINVIIFSLSALLISKLNIIKVNGIIISYFLGFLSSAIFCFYAYKKVFKFLNLNFLSIFKKIYKERDLTFYLSSSNFVNTLSNELPIFILSIYYGDKVLSFFSLVLRVVSVPVTIFSKSFGTVNFRHITNKIKNNELIFFYLLKLVIGLLFITVPPILLCYLYAESIFSFVFGEQWSKAGEILNILSIAISLKFVGLTIFESIFPLKIVKNISIWQYSLTSFIVLLAFYGEKITANEFFHILAAIESVMYLILLVYILYKSYKHDQKNI